MGRAGAITPAAAPRGELQREGRRGEPSLSRSRLWDWQVACWSCSATMQTPPDERASARWSGDRIGASHLVMTGELDDSSLRGNALMGPHGVDDLQADKVGHVTTTGEVTWNNQS
jgi:hypothetical protein